MRLSARVLLAALFAPLLGCRTLPPKPQAEPASQAVPAGTKDPNALWPGLPEPPLRQQDAPAAKAIGEAFQGAPPAIQALYLHDLLLSARLSEDAVARSLLFYLLEGSAANDQRGIEATLTVLDHLAGRARQAGLLPLARLDEEDAADLSDAADPAAVAAYRRELSATGDPGAYAALLLLHGTCLRILRDAIQRPLPERIAMTRGCQPLLGSFGGNDRDGNSEPRPRPGPSWTSLFRGLAGLLEQADRAAPRLHRLLALLRDGDRNFQAQVERDGLAPFDVESVVLPATQPDYQPGDQEKGLRLLPYQQEPVVWVHQGLVQIGQAQFQARDSVLYRRLVQLLRGDDRRRLAVAGADDEPCGAITGLREQAQKLGLSSLLLLLRGPRPALSILALPLEVRSEEGAQQVARSGQARLLPHGAVPAEFTLVLDTDANDTNNASDNALLRSGDGGIRVSLPDLRTAFPAETDLKIALAPDLTLGAAVRKLLRIRHFFPHLLLSPLPRHQSHREASLKLAQRLRRRIHATVEALPQPPIRNDDNDRLVPMRACYLDALDKDDKDKNNDKDDLAGTLRIVFADPAKPGDTTPSIVDITGSLANTPDFLACVRSHSAGLPDGLANGLPDGLLDHDRGSSLLLKFAP